MPKPSRPLHLAPEYVFLILGSVFGLAMVFVTPPFEVNDEIDHFFRAYQVSELQLRAQMNKAHAISTGVELPQVYLDFWRNYVYHDFPLDPENKLSRARLRELFDAPLNPDKKIFIGFVQTRYPFLIYIPQAFGIALGRACGLPALALLYTGRLVNLFCWLAVMFVAIRALPAAQWLFLLLALTPMGVRQGASVCGDALTNAFAFLFVAVVLRYTFSGQDLLPKRAKAALCATAVLVLLAKQAYFFLPGLVFLIPVHRFGTPRDYIRTLIIFWALCAVAFALTVVQTAYGYIDPPGYSMSGQMAYIMHHPLHFAMTLLFSVADRFIYRPIIPETFVGFQSWRDVHVLLPSWILMTYWILLCFAAVTSGDLPSAPRFAQRLLLAAVGSACIVPVFAMTYLHFIPVGGTYITTVWGRMFIPIMPLLFLAIYGLTPLPEKCRTRLPAFYGTFATIVLAAGIHTLVATFYIPETNLIPNGDFGIWIAGLPEGWSGAVSSPARWTVLLEEDPDLGPGARQTWQKPDRDLTPDRRFGITLTSLKPYSHYRFFCRARCPNRNRFYIEAWSPVDDAQIKDGWRCLEHYVAKIPAASPHAHFRSFSGDFFTGRSRTARLVSVAGDPQGEYPATVTWDDWTLTRIPLGMPWRRFFLWLSS